MIIPAHPSCKNPNVAANLRKLALSSNPIALFVLSAHWDAIPMVCLHFYPQCIIPYGGVLALDAAPCWNSLQGAVEGADSRDLPFVLATAPANQEALFVVCLLFIPVLQKNLHTRCAACLGQHSASQHLQDGCKFCKSMSLTFFAAE